MKSIFIALLFFSFSSMLLAQNKGRLEIGAVLSPEHLHTRVEDELYKDTYSNRLFLNGGLMSRYFVGEKVAIGAGLGYVQTGFASMVSDTSILFGRLAELEYRMDAVALPIGVDWYLVQQGKIGVSMGVDVVNVFVVKEKRENLSLPEGSANRVQEVDDWEDYFLNLRPNFQMEFKLSEKLKLTASSFFGYQIKVSDAVVKTWQYSSGLDVGVFLEI